MNTFDDFKIKKQLRHALDDLGLEKPTPIQQESYSTILAGSDFVGIAQTGTGKTIAYLLPILSDLKYSDQTNPRVLILAPTRELVIQIVEEIEKLTAYLSVRTLAVYGGTNINTQKKAVAEGLDIIVGTPRRLYDLVLTNVLRLKSIKKLVIDEVDIMLDFGYKTQLRNIFDYLPSNRQNLLFSATMTTYFDELIDGFLVNPVKKTISISGTPLDTISQQCYCVPNFYTKVNLLNYLLKDKEEYSKVLIFVATKVNADRLFETLDFEDELAVIHSSKAQNYRSRSIEGFENGTSRILIATDVIARGIDIEKITTVISFDTPLYPENYIHRIGRTGRAEQRGKSILLYNENEKALKESIENLMNYTIPFIEFPEDVEISRQLTPQERKPIEHKELNHKNATVETGASFHEKSAKNSKEKIERKSYSKKMKEKFKKPLRRGDKIQNMKRRRGSDALIFRARERMTLRLITNKMKGQKKQDWIDEGYRIVSESGFSSLHIESIARGINKNKSSFYHYFGDAELFETALLDYHLQRAEEFAKQAGECESVRPELVNLFLEHKTDLLFHKQLRINRANPEFKKCFEKVFEKYEVAVMDKWAEFLGLRDQRLFAQTFLHLISENFLLQITQENYSYAWLDNYLNGISNVLRQMHSGSGK